MEKPTIDSTIKELLNFISGLEDSAGSACQNSEGSQGCEEANDLQDLYKRISELIK